MFLPLLKMQGIYQAGLLPGVPEKLILPNVNLFDKLERKTVYTPPVRGGISSRRKERLEREAKKALETILQQPLNVRLVGFKIEDPPQEKWEGPREQYVVRVTPFSGGNPLYIISLLSTPLDEIPFHYSSENDEKRIIRVTIGNKNSLERIILQSEYEVIPPIHVLKKEYAAHHYERGKGFREVSTAYGGVLLYLVREDQIREKATKDPLLILLSGSQPISKRENFTPHGESVKGRVREFNIFEETRIRQGSYSSLLQTVYKLTDETNKNMEAIVSTINKKLREKKKTHLGRYFLNHRSVRKEELSEWLNS